MVHGPREVFCKLTNWDSVCNVYKFVSLSGFSLTTWLTEQNINPVQSPLPSYAVLQLLEDRQIANLMKDQACDQSNDTLYNIPDPVGGWVMGGRYFPPFYPPEILDFVLSLVLLSVAWKLGHNLWSVKERKFMFWQKYFLHVSEIILKYLHLQYCFSFF